MDSDVDHSLDGTDPDVVRPYGWWLVIREMIDEWREIKHMSPVELRRYCGGSPSFTKKRKTASQGGT